MIRKCLSCMCASLAIGLVLATAAQSAAPGPMGWWKLDESSGTIAHDSSGNGKDGTVEGNPIWLPTGGKVNGALQFDGAGDQVTIRNAGSFGITNLMSVAVWMKIPATGRANEYVWGYDTYDPPRLMREGTATSFKFTGGGIPGNGVQVNLGGAGWYHVVAVVDGANCKLYVNGSVAGQVPYSGKLTTFTNWRIGNAYGDDTRRFIGIIDDVRVYNRAVTKEEVQLIVEGNLPAKTPSPADEVTDVARDVALSWKPGQSARTHDVYFGTVLDDVSNASRTKPLGVLVSQSQDANTYDPAGLLEFGRTYYWRIDEVNAAPDYTIFKGRVWRFVTEPLAYPLPSKSITATASSSNSAAEGPQNTVNGSGLSASDLHSAQNTDMWLSGMAGPQPTWIQCEFDKVYRLYQMWVWNHNSLLEPAFGLGFKKATVEYSVDGAKWTPLSATPEFARGPGAPGYAHNTVVDLGGVAAKYVKITAGSNWGGLVAQYGLSEVRFLYIPVDAREPNPRSGATDVSLGTLDQPADVTLRFRAGREAAKHNMYLSTNQQAVIDGTAPATALTGASSGPMSLDLGQTYYWRVDEVNDRATPTTWPGAVWDFTTQKYFLVDDIEDYNDYTGHAIFDTWTDGFGTKTNGATVGYTDPDFSKGEHFAETKAVHSGKQSLPFFYDNKVGYSEATLSLGTGSNWTARGAGVLSLWFLGDPANAAVRVYVALNGKAVYHADSKATQTNTWTEWTVDLKAFADQGVDLTKIKTLALGFGDKNNPVAGGSGKMCFDDIRLYPRAQKP